MSQAFESHIGAEADPLWLEHKNLHTSKALSS